jgi:LuxR family maltose regulon positive regulatory protein
MATATGLRTRVVGEPRLRATAFRAAGPVLRIRALGTTVVEAGAEQLDGPWLDQRAGQLLKYLVAERWRAVSIDEIGESIWPGAGYAVGSSVRYYVHTLRRILEPDRGNREPSAFILVRRGSYRLNSENVSIDADEFETHIRAGLEQASGDSRAAVVELERGIALYRGEFLAELPYAEWALAERQQMHGLACSAARRLADIRFEQERPELATNALERLAALQPFDEEVHRQLMELDIAHGRHTDVVRRYAALRCRLLHIFGQEPSFTPADLATPRP